MFCFTFLFHNHIHNWESLKRKQISQKIEIFHFQVSNIRLLNAMGFKELNIYIYIYLNFIIFNFIIVLFILNYFIIILKQIV